MNDILIKRICKLIAMAYAISETKVYEIFLKTNSIDKVLNILQSGEKNYESN